MHTEKATDRFDLPHAVERGATILPVNPPTALCQCGRPDSDSIHQPNAVLERASEHDSPLTTEKGI